MHAFVHVRAHALLTSHAHAPRTHTRVFLSLFNTYRYHSHVKSCSACSGALANFRRLAAAAAVAAGLAVAAAAGLAAAAVAVADVSAAALWASPTPASAAAAAAATTVSPGPAAAVAAALAAVFAAVAAWAKHMVGMGRMWPREALARLRVHACCCWLCVACCCQSCRTVSIPHPIHTYARVTEALSKRLNTQANAYANMSGAQAMRWCSIGAQTNPTTFPRGSRTRAPHPHLTP